MINAKRKQKWVQSALLVGVVIALLSSWVFMRDWEQASLKNQTQPTRATLEVVNETLPSGAQISIASRHELPLLDIVLVFDAGSARDASQPGIAFLTARLFGKDTLSLSTDTIHGTLESVGSQLEASANRDTLTIHLRTLTDKQALGPSVDMLKTLLAETAFKPETVTREKANVSALIQSKQNDPSQVIGDAFYEAIYGSHPYAHPVTGTVESIAAIDPSALTRFYQNLMVQANTTIAIVGDIDATEGKNLAKQLLDQLAQGTKPTPLPAVLPTAGREITLAFPSSQTHWLLGMPALEKRNPDRDALVLGNHVLGGIPLTSQLFLAVREEEGLVYNISSQVLPLQQAGPFVIALQTRTDQAKAAEQITESVLQDFIQKGPQPESLQAAKDNLNGAFTLTLSHNDALAYYIASQRFYGLPIEDAEAFKSRIDAISAERIVQAFQHHIQLADLYRLSLGQPVP